MLLKCGYYFYFTKTPSIFYDIDNITDATSTKLTTLPTLISFFHDNLLLTPQNAAFLVNNLFGHVVMGSFKPCIGFVTVGYKNRGDRTRTCDPLHPMQVR